MIELNIASELNYRNNKLINLIYKMFKSNVKHQNSKESITTKATISSLLIKEGYISKLKSKKRRYFVLYGENENEPARLEYYENEKRFKTNPNAYKRQILLKDCFAVIEKNDPRFKNNKIFVFAIYTRSDCFSLMFDNQDEMNSWFSLINEVHKKTLTKHNSSVLHNDYDKIWYVVIKDKKSLIKGAFYMCLTPEEIHLYKVDGSNAKEPDKRLSSSLDKSVDQVDKSNSTSDKQTIYQTTNEGEDNSLLRFPFSLIRSYGHQTGSNCILSIHLGRSSDIGSCELCFELKDCDTSQHVHSLIANSMLAAKNSEYRMRSNSENNRTISRLRNKSLSDKTSSQLSSSTPISHSKTTTSISQQTPSSSNPVSGSNSKSSKSLKFLSNNFFLNSCDSNKIIKNEKEKEKESSTEYVASPVAYSTVAYTLPNNNNKTSMPFSRSRSTSESSTSQTVQVAHAKGLQNLFKNKQQQSINNSQQLSSNNKACSPTNQVLSNESINENDDEKDSDYYMITPVCTQENSAPAAALSIKEEEYLIVDDSSFIQSSSPPIIRTLSNASTVQLNNHNTKLENIKSSDLKLVPTTSSLAAKLSKQSSIETAQPLHCKAQNHPQYYSPVNSFVDLPVGELNETEQVDEYIQVEYPSATTNTAAKKQSTSSLNSRHNDHKLEVISSEPSSESSPKTTTTTTEQPSQASNVEEDEDYIDIESFSSTATTNTATNRESENFEANLSPISSTSCSINRVKTFSMSSNNTSNNELNSLGTSPSFYSTTPVNREKEEVYKLEKVKSYFNSNEDCDYIKPARSYSMSNHHKFKHSSHYNSMTKSKSNTLNGPTLAGNPNHFTAKKALCNHFDEQAQDNRIRAYSMEHHTTAKKDMLLKRIRFNQLQRQENTLKKDDTIEDEESSEKCLSTPILAEKDYHRNRSATFTSFNSSTASTSSKKTNEDSSEEDEMMCIDLSKSDLSKSAPRFEPQNEFHFTPNQYSIKEKFKALELNLDANELAKDLLLKDN